MKHYHILKQTAALLLAAGAFSACSKSFLEQDPKGQFLEDNYYQTEQQAFTGLVAAYAPLTDAGGGIEGTYATTLGPLNAASDECWAGGGGPSDMEGWHAMADYNRLTPQVGPQGEFWAINYQGIYRANLLLAKLEGTSMDEGKKKRFAAEAEFLRAHYYFDLVRLFKNIILTEEPLKVAENRDLEQSKPEAVYAQVEKDLLAAIPDLPTTVPPEENGRITQGAAIALLGKVYLYEQKWAEAAEQLAKVNGPTPGGAATPVYGYKLMDNYADLFSPDHKFNSEAIFEWAYSGSGNVGWSNWFPGKGNVYVAMVGPRSFTGPTYYGGGWSFNPIIPTTLVKDMHPSAGVYDPRYAATIANIDSLTAATSTSYVKGDGNTGYFIQKYAPLKKYQVASGTVELNFPNDYIEIRLADTYLMEAEALVHSGGNTARAQSLLDAVRKRVGLGSVAVNLDNIYHERHMELATEGHRWFDLVRTGRAASVLAFKGFVAGKNEILPIPYAEFEFDSKLNQNPVYQN